MATTDCPPIILFSAVLLLSIPSFLPWSVQYVLSTYGTIHLIAVLFVCEGSSFPLPSQVTHTRLRESHHTCKGGAQFLLGFGAVANECSKSQIFCFPVIILDLTAFLSLGVLFLPAAPSARKKNIAVGFGNAWSL